MTLTLVRHTARPPLRVLREAPMLKLVASPEPIRPKVGDWVYDGLDPRVHVVTGVDPDGALNIRLVATFPGAGSHRPRGALSYDQPTNGVIPVDEPTRPGWCAPLSYAKRAEMLAHARAARAARDATDIPPLDAA